MSKTLQQTPVNKGVGSTWQWMGASLLALTLATFWGNKLIGAGQALLAVAIVSALLRKDGKWDSRNFSRSTWCLIGFVAFAIISILANLTEVSSAIGHGRKLRYELIGLLLLGMVTTRRLFIESTGFRDLALGAWLIAMVSAGLLGIVSFLWWGKIPLLNEVGYKGRVSGLFGQVMTFAHLLMLSSVVLAALAISPKIVKRITRIPHWVFAAATVFSGICLYFTYTRGAVLGAAAGLFVLAFLHSRKTVIALFVIALSFLAYTSKDHFGSGDQSRYFMFHNSLRMNQWTASALAFADNPLFGVGFNQFEPQSVELKKQYGLPPAKSVGIPPEQEMIYFESHSHNNYLEAFAGTGLFGGLAFLGFCGFWAYEALRSRFAMILFPPVVAFLVSGFFENTFFDSEVLNGILLFYVVSRIVISQETTAGGERITPPLSQPSSA